MLTSPYLSETLDDVKAQKEIICIFRCTKRGFARVNILAHSGGGKAFPKNCISITRVLTAESRDFLKKAVADASASYILLLTKNKVPLLIVTKTAPLSGVCVAFELQSDARTAMAFFRTVPTFSLQIDPAIERLPAQQASDPADLRRLSMTFRRVFSIFEAGEYYQKGYSDPLLTFKLFKHRVQTVAEAFGASPSFLTQAKFDEEPKRYISINNTLLSLSMISLFCIMKGCITEEGIHIIFMLVDGCPAVCLHFRGYTEHYKTSPLLYYLRFLFSESSAYFYTGSGEKIMDEAAKIPGIRYIVKDNEPLPIGEHILVVFSPVHHDWKPYMNRCPIVTLPSDFYLAEDDTDALQDDPVAAPPFYGTTPEST